MEREETGEKASRKSAVSSSEMKEIDRKTIEEYGLDEKILMESAGLMVAEFLREKFSEKGFTFYAGKGNNGGDALVAARRLRNWGKDIEVVLASEGLDGIREQQLETLKELGADINVETSEKDSTVAVDGLLGYSIEGDPRPPLVKVIDEINRYENVVSIDVASGLDPDTGKNGDPCARPDFTVTLAAPFKGLTEETSGEIFVADIGIPREAFEDLGYSIDFFEESPLKRFRP